MHESPITEEFLLLTVKPPVYKKDEIQPTGCNILRCTLKNASNLFFSALSNK